MNCNHRAVALTAFLVALLTVAVPTAVASDGSDAAGEFVDYNLSGGMPISVSAGERVKLCVDIERTIELASPLYIYMSASVKDDGGNSYSRISASVSSNAADSVNTRGIAIVRVPDGDNPVRFIIDLDVNPYASHGSYTLEYTYTVRDLSKDPESNVLMTASGVQAFDVNSTLSNDGMFNKFLGIIPNNLQSPLDTPWFTSIATFVAWIVIGFIVSLVAVPVLTFLTSTKDNPDRPKLRRTIFVQFTIMFVVYAAVSALCVLGISESLTDEVRRWANIVYVINIAIISWRCYRTLLDRIAERTRGKDLIPGGDVQDFESFKPLFIYIGEIAIAIIGVSVSMSLLGFDLTAIITSAGIVSLGITFGAQEVLKQFFAGLVMLATRPFKKGDLIMIGGNSTVYRVRKINVMNTELENWDNSDITICPNNSLTSGTIKNITRDTLRYKVHLYMEVSYNSDIAKVRSILLEAAYENPRVITDGSADMPSTRLTEFADSNIQVRLTFWVDDFNDNGSITGDLRVAIWDKFQKNGIDIDYSTIILKTGDSSD